MKCKICNKNFYDIKIFSKHLKEHNLKSKQYYDKYLIREGEGVCLNCGNPTAFRSITDGYHRFCSRKCMSNSCIVKNKTKKTNLLRYGVPNPFQSEEIKEKIKNYNLSTYGVDNISKAEIIKQKKKDTTLKNFGVAIPAQSDVVQQKMKATCKERFGVDNAFKAKKIKEKIKTTLLEHYGVDSPLKIEEIHKKGVDAANSREARQKAAMTRRGNNNESSWEDFMENKLQALSIKYIMHYDKDVRYPFPCDFYLPDYDIFIEINGYWTHGGHLFDKNNVEDIQTLCRWQQKAKEGHKQYKIAIRVWTEKDILKHNYAVNNKLTYIILWTFEDIKNFFIDWKKFC